MRWLDGSREAEVGVSLGRGLAKQVVEANGKQETSYYHGALLPCGVGTIADWRPRRETPQENEAAPNDTDPAKDAIPHMVLFRSSVRGRRS